jgi:hypothetical protein
MSGPTRARANRHREVIRHISPSKLVECIDTITRLAPDIAVVTIHEVRDIIYLALHRNLEVAVARMLPHLGCVFQTLLRLGHSRFPNAAM